MTSSDEIVIQCFVAFEVIAVGYLSVVLENLFFMDLY